MPLGYVKSRFHLPMRPYINQLSMVSQYYDRLRMCHETSHVAFAINRSTCIHKNIHADVIMYSVTVRHHFFQSDMWNFQLKNCWFINYICSKHTSYIMWYLTQLWSIAAVRIKLFVTATSSLLLNARKTIITIYRYHKCNQCCWLYVSASAHVDREFIKWHSESS